MSQFTNEAAIWHYNDLSFELDLTDVDNIELYEKTFAKMQEDVKNMPATGTQSEIVRAYCRVMRDVFDNLFGAGTSDKLFVSGTTPLRSRPATRTSSNLSPGRISP